MNGLEYLNSNNNIEKINENLGFDIRNENELDNILKKSTAKINNFKADEQSKILEYIQKIENNPKIFEKDLTLKIKSINKKISNGNLETGILNGISEIFLMKKPSKSKHLRKKKR